MFFFSTCIHVHTIISKDLACFNIIRAMIGTKEIGYGQQTGENVTDYIGNMLIGSPGSDLDREAEYVNICNRSVIDRVKCESIELFLRH